MCWVCNPFCGRCIPPKKNIVFCPECNTANMLDIELAAIPAAKPCQKCGKDLVSFVIPETVFCTYAALECANPCGFRQQVPADGIPVICRRRSEPVRNAVFATSPGV